MAARVVQRARCWRNWTRVLPKVGIDRASGCRAKACSCARWRSSAGEGASRRPSQPSARVSASRKPAWSRRSAAAHAPWWQRAFGSLLRVQRTDRAVAVQPAERAAAMAGLQLEISLARAAAERRDRDGYRAALARADGWLQRLMGTSKALERQRAQLQELAQLPLALSIPTLGSTLAQLRQQRAH